MGSRHLARVPYPQPSSAAASTVMRANRSADTKPEIALRSELHSRGLRFRKNFSIEFEGGQTRADIVFTRKRVAVFVDGCFWHRCPDHGTQPRANAAYWGPKLDRNVLRDRRVSSALEEAGWSVLRIWEHTPSGQAAELVASIVLSRSKPAFG